MPKFQIIVESVDSKIWFDDEFLDWIDENIDFREQFKVLYVNNLDGMRKELYAKQDKLIDGILHASEPSEIVESTFEEIEDLFKIKE